MLKHAGALSISLILKCFDVFGEGNFTSSVENKQDFCKNKTKLTLVRALKVFTETCKIK